MLFTPPLTAMLSSASTDMAKTWLGLKGWPAAFTLLRQYNLVPTSGWGKNASSLALMIVNGFVDWYHGEETPIKRFTKDILKDIPSEYMERIYSAMTVPATAGSRSHNPVWDLEPDELKQFLACVRTLDHPTQLRLRGLAAELDAAKLKTLTADATDMATLLDFLMPAAPSKPDSQAPGAWLNDRFEAVANFLVPRLGR